jgi:hypothetical protein
LQTLLSEGVSFTGRTTEIFYLAYGTEKDGRLSALICKKSDFTFDKGTMRLKQFDPLHPKPGVLSRVLLKAGSIVPCPVPESNTRYIYGSLTEPPEEAKIPIRSLEHYAADYVNSFKNKHGHSSLTKIRQTEIAGLIQKALDSPDDLREYLDGATPPDVTRLKKAVARILNEDDTKLVLEAALEDGDIHARLLDEFKASSDSEVRIEKARLAQVITERNAAEKDLREAQTQVKQLREAVVGLQGSVADWQNQLTDLQNEVETKRSEASDELQALREEVMQRLEDDIVLKIGLAAVAKAVPSSSAPRSRASDDAEPLATAGAPLGKPCDKSFTKLFESNLRNIGLQTISGGPKAFETVAHGIAGALATTQFIAVRQPVARAVADALACTVGGYSARTITLPDAYHDLRVLDELTEGPEPVVLIDNAIDAVNETALFHFVNSPDNKVIVLAFSSYANLNLVAPELWERVFLPNCEGLAAFGGHTHLEKLGSNVGDAPRPSDAQLSDLPVIVEDLLRDFSPEIPRSTALLPAVVRELLAEEDQDHADCAIAAHLLVATGALSGSQNIPSRIRALSNTDASLKQFLLRASIHE